MATLRRQVKNMVKNYSESEVKVREATSNDPWGPSSTLMSEISDMTYNIVALGEIMRMIWKRLNDHGKNWRHVYKSLVLLDYLIKNGNDKVAQQCKEHIVAIQTLKDFQFTEEQKDQGANVREKAKQLVNLLRDDERLKEERAKAFRARERYAQNAMGIGSDNKMVFAAGVPKTASKPNASYADPYGGAGAPPARVHADLEAVRPSDPNEEDLQLKLAIMLSQQEADEDEKRKRADDAKLQLALEQSKTEGQPNSGLVDLADPTDPWSSSSATHNDIFSSTSKPTDPWSSPPPPKSNGHADPWTNGSAKQTSTNPWTNGAAHSTAAATDPWGGSTGGTTTGGGSSTTSSVKQPDEFDLFTANRNVASTNSHDPFGDMFSDTTAKPPVAAAASTNPWSESDKPKFDPFSTTNGQSQQPKLAQSSSSNAIRKTPESFLGENSGLVNLENLIPSRPKSTNPFGSAITPGAGAQQPTMGGMSNSTSIGHLNNPFSAVVQPTTMNGMKPSINQLSNNQQAFSAFGTNAGFMPQQPPQLAQPLIIPPMMGTGGSGSSPFGGQTNMFGGFGGAPMNMNASGLNSSNSASGNTNASSTNPFLMM